MGVRICKLPGGSAMSPSEPQRLRSKRAPGPLWMLPVLLLIGSASAEAQIATGSYVGDGTAGRPIAGLGFQPDVVIVKVDYDNLTNDTCSAGVIRTSTMPVDATKLLKGTPPLSLSPCDSLTTGLLPNLVQTLDADGFTLGNDNRVNGALAACGGVNCTYHWVAFKADSNLKLGTYGGTGGSLSISGLGFSPEYVMVLPANNNRAQHRTPAGGARSDRLDAGGATTLGITSLDVTGFTVTSDSAPNNLSDLGITYYYVAWNAVAGRTAVGTYAGNSSDNRPIDQAGFRPSYVIVQSNTDAGGSDAIQRTASMFGDASVNFRGATNINRIQALRPLGFEVGSYAGVNDSAESYAFVAFGAGDSPCASGGSWWNYTWKRRRKLSFDNSGQPSSLSSFPVLVKLDATRVDYARTQNLGEDIRFVDADDRTLLDHEIERWDEAGTSYVWVRVPQVNGASSSDSIYMYYDNAAALDGQNVAGVWDGDFKMVHHLEETAGQHQDSTSFNNDSYAVDVTPQGSAAGQINGADGFAAASTDNVYVADAATLDVGPAESVTIEAWIQTTKWDGMVVSKENQPGEGELQLWVDGAGRASFWVKSAGGAAANANSATVVSDNVWHHLVGRWDRATSTAEVFVDGVSVASATNALVGDVSTSTDLAIGEEGDGPPPLAGGFSFGGTMDEIRFSKAATPRANDWIRAQYLSMSDQFVAYGAETGSCYLRSIGTASDRSTATGDGTVAVSPGEVSVTGTGTLWKTWNRGRGDLIEIEGTHYVVRWVASETQLTLASPFTGTGGPGTSYTMRRQFTNLTAWETCVDGGPCSAFFSPPVTASLVADNRAEIGIAYDDSPFVLTANVVIDGSTTDATHTINLTADGPNRHNGTPGTGVVIDANLGPNSVIIRDSNVTLEWLELVKLRGANNVAAVQVAGTLSPLDVPTNVLLQNLLVHDFFDATFEMSGLRLSQDDVGKGLTVRNTMIWDGDRRGIEADGPTDTLLVENCSIHGMVETGVFAAGSTNSTVTVRNTIATSNPSGDFMNAGTWGPGSSNNIASAGTVPGLNPLTAQAVDLFVTPGVDLHLKTGAVAIDSALSLAASFTLDIDGGVRPGGAGWDRGADEFATTEVVLESFAAVGLDSAVELRWKTASELRNLGFHLHRSSSASGPWARITASLIPGLGSSPVGQAYAFVDSGLANGTPYFYRLEDVDASGVATFHGPVSATPRAGAASPAEDTNAGSTSNTSDSSSSSLRSWGEPGVVDFKILRRTRNQLLVELQTGGFFTTTDASSGRLRVEIPTFEPASDPQGPALPLKRVLLDALVGRGARIASVRSLELLSFPGLVPDAQGFSEMAVSFDGTVRPRRRPAPLRASLETLLPEEPARLAASVFLGEQKKLVLEMSPLRYDTRGERLLLARRLRVLIVFDRKDPLERGRGSVGRRAPREKAPSSSESLLAFVHVSNEGLQALSFEEVFPSRQRAIPLRSLKLSREGQAVPFHVEPWGTAFGHGGLLVFHADEAPPSTSFTGEAAYSLSLASDGVVMAEVKASPSGEPVSSSVALSRFETNRNYQPGLLEANDPWLWEVLVVGAPKTIGVSLAGVDAVSALPARLSLALQGASDVEGVSDHHLRAYVNGALVGEARFDGKRPASLEAELPASLLREGSNDVTLENTGSSGVASFVFLDRISLVYPQTPTARGDRFEGTWASSGTAEVTGFASPPLGVVEVAGGETRWLTGVEWTGASVRFRAEADRRTLIASAQSIPHPRVRFPEPSSLSQATQADYIVIAPQAFLDPARRLLERRQGQGLSTLSVSLEELADRFGEGEISAEALRRFLSHAFHHFSPPSPRYVLLLGGSTSDPRNFTGRSRPSPLPALMVKTSYLWTVSDPTLAAANGEDALPDLAIGRLPATTLEEAEAMIDKLLAWEDTVQTLSGRAVLVADNPDVAGDFEANVTDIEASFLAGRETQRLFLSQLGSQMRPAILQAFNEGASLMSYVGHGGAAVWASENVLNSWDAASLLSQSRQPVLLTLNCLNGYFLAPAFDSLAEAFLKAEGRGTVAGFSPSGLSLDGPAHLYHRAVVAEFVSGRHERLGDALLAAQAAYAETGAMPELLSIYHLLGDPAMKIR